MISSSFTLRELSRRVGCLDFLYPSLAISCRRLSTSQCKFARSGRLVDLVADGKIDINMRKYSSNKKLFDYTDEKIVPKELSKVEKDLLEPITMVAVQIKQYKQSQSWETKQEIWSTINRLFTKLSKREHRQFTNDIEKLDLNDPNLQHSSRILHIIRRHGYTQEDLKHWVDCIMSKTISEALKIMEGRKWPEFLLRFTMKRDCESRHAAYELTRLFQDRFSSLSKHAQLDCMIKMIRILQLHLPDFLPGICHIFVDQSHRDLHSSFVFNQLLWCLSRFGKSWSDFAARNISTSQRVLVQKMISNKINLDTKGYLSLAYILRNLSVDKSRMFVNIVKYHDYQPSHEEQWALADENLHTHRFGVFPYREGLRCMEILLAVDQADVFRIINNVPRGTRSAILWTCAIKRFRELGLGTDTFMAQIWKQILDEGVRPTSAMLLELCRDRRYPGFNHRILSEAHAMGVHFSKSLLNNVLHVVSRNVISYKKMAEAFYEMDKSQNRYDVLLSKQLKYDRALIWRTYQRMLEDGFEPTKESLSVICLAAQDTSLKWNNDNSSLFAAQLATVEFKRWVRGALLDRSDIHDAFKVQPDSELFHNYVVMLGKAGYKDELLEVMPWIQRLEIVPSTTLLSGLIAYSPNGEHLHKHGSVVGNYGWPWPSDADLAVYKFHMKKKYVK